MEHAGGKPAGDRQRAAVDEQALEKLRFGWGDAYEIGHDDKRGYWARRLDGLGEDLTADDPDALWNAMNADYTAKAVPRDLPAGDPR